MPPSPTTSPGWSIRTPWAGSETTTQLGALVRRLFDGSRGLRVADHVEALHRPAQLPGEAGNGGRTDRPDDEVDSLQQLFFPGDDLAEPESLLAFPTDQLVTGMEVDVTAHQLVGEFV